MLKPGDATEVTVNLADGCRLTGVLYQPQDARAPERLCLCIHGLAVDSNVWQFFADAWLAQGGSAICFDLRGHGLSARGTRYPWRQFSPTAMADDLIQACQLLNLQPDYVVAQSFGNLVALELLQALQHKPAWTVRQYLAITPVWSANHTTGLKWLQSLKPTLRFLLRLGKQVGYIASRTPQRRDHTEFAQHPDHHLPRFVAEARTIGWLHYALLSLVIQWRRWRNPPWQAVRGLPVRIIGATDEGLWHNPQLCAVASVTDWPLYWLDMRHVSLSTDASYTQVLMALIQQENLLS